MAHIHSRRRRTGRAALLAGTLVLTFAKSTLADKEPAALPSVLHVTGTQLVDAQNMPVLLRGVNAASMEWTSNGEGHILDTVRVAIKDWHANIIRLPLSQDRWFGKAPEQTDAGVAYRALVKQVVETCAAQNCYVIFDLQWNDAGEWGKNIGQHILPDENSVTFWKDCAATYKNNPAILFDLYNEPHDVSWDLWRDGGTVTEKDRKLGDRTYKGVGLQTLLNTVRDTGAMNVVIAGGLDWSYDFSGILAGRQLSDPKGHGVVYDNHAYPFKGETVQKWITRMETAVKVLPVFVGEFGSDPKGGAGETGEQWIRHVLQVLNDHHWNYTAWDLHPAAAPSLITDWNYTPTPHFGVWVKQALAGTLPPYAPPAAQ